MKGREARPTAGLHISPPPSGTRRMAQGASNLAPEGHMTDTPPTLSPLQAARLRAADGLASEEDQRLLTEAGLDASGLQHAQQRLHDGLRSALSSVALREDLWPQVCSAAGLVEAGPPSAALRDALGGSPRTVEIADDVMEALGQAHPGLGVQDALRAAAGAEPDVGGAVVEALGLTVVPVAAALVEAAGQPPDVASATLAAMGQPEPAAGVQEALHAAAGAPPDVAQGVLERLELPTSSLRTALSDAAGPAPDITGAVFAELGLEQAPGTLRDALRSAAGPAPDLGSALRGAVEGAPGTTAAALPTPANTDRQRFPMWSALAVGAAALAAAVLFFVSPDADHTEPVSFELAAVNEVEIEDLTVGDEAMVQVLQFEEDAPTIIFVDFPDEAAAPGDEGATL